jgi:farnesyl diphosphate synthase
VTPVRLENVRTTDTSRACAFTRSQILELFHDVTYQTSCGQLIDLITAPIGQARGFAMACTRRTHSDRVGLQVDLSKYTIETYMRIVTYKTAFYTFYLPAASAMHLCGIENERAFDLARDICVRLGQFFQIQDDYLDCYGDPAVIGKLGTDIEDNKCSWLVVQALARCSDAQRKVFEVRCSGLFAPSRSQLTRAPQLNYGQNDPAKVAAIKAVYAELKLEAVYHEYESKSYEELTALINSQDLLPKALFGDMLAKIYKRQK